MEIVPRWVWIGAIFYFLLSLACLIEWLMSLVWWRDFDPDVSEDARRETWK